MNSMPFNAARLAFAACLLSPSALLAQSAVGSVAPPAGKPAVKPAAKPVQSKDAAPMQTVEVKGSATNYDPRRDDTASKTVLNSEEIRKYGDDNIYDVLKRAPGVTVTGNAIRMRGLSGGYTQILVNGDRPPPGFSLDALTPDQIERIEIVRSASAEYSMQSIAGTVNIVLRKLVSKPQHDVRIGAVRSPQSRSATINGTWAEKVGSLSYFLNGAVYGGSSESVSNGADQLIGPGGQASGQVLQERQSRYQGEGGYEGLVFFPRLSWKLDNGDELNLQAGTQAGRSHWKGRSTTDNVLGTFPSPDWIETSSSSPSSQFMARAEINWVARLAGGKLDLSVSGERSRNNNESVNALFTENRAQRLDRDWDTTTRASRQSIRGKFTRSLFDGHALASGFDASVQETDEVRERLEQLGTAAPTDIVENFAPKIIRLAGYVQDEWSIGKQLSVYLGMRWEGVETDSQGSGLANTTTRTLSRNHVLSPVGQALYKFPGQSGRQLRLALTRTYKAPTIDQLTARRSEAALNTRFSPDSSGNPALRPELANGIDLGYESFWAPGALFSLTASRRTIIDYIRTRLDQDAQGKWLYQPLNDGTASVRSLEAEFKMPLKLLSAAAEGFDARASFSRNWSQVAAVPGPNNRLDAQTPASVNLAIDYKKGELGFGASLACQQAGWVRISDAQSQRQQTRRDLDAYALWKLDPRLQLRLSLANILGMNNTSERLYQNADGVSRQTSFQPGWARIGLNLEMKL
jgi:outer membrane receptor for ferrienterochelin and colicins